MNSPISAAASPLAEQRISKNHAAPDSLCSSVTCSLSSDRVNVGIAQLDMKHDVGFSDFTYSIGAGIFFLGYVLMEVPSNPLLTRIGVKRTFSRIMVLWGILAAATAFVTLPSHFYTVRFLLGLAEAGLYPGIIFYLTRWYPVERRAKSHCYLHLCNGHSRVAWRPDVRLADDAHGGHPRHAWLAMDVHRTGLAGKLPGIAAFFFLDDGPEKAVVAE